MSHGPSAPAQGASAHAHTHEPYVPVFTAGSARRKELDDIISRYPEKRAALLPALWMVQQERGWISEDAMREVGDALGPHVASELVRRADEDLGQVLPIGVSIGRAAESRIFPAGK